MKNGQFYANLSTPPPRNAIKLKSLFGCISFPRMSQKPSNSINKKQNKTKKFKKIDKKYTYYLIIRLCVFSVFSSTFVFFHHINTIHFVVSLFTVCLCKSFIFIWLLCIFRFCLMFAFFSFSLWIFFYRSVNSQHIFVIKFQFPFIYRIDIILNDL